MIVCHPDNLRDVKRLVETVNHTALTNDYSTLPFSGEEFVTSENCPKTSLQPTGRIIAPDGTVKEKSDWSWSPDRFVVYKESDLPWLLELKFVQLEMAQLPVFYSLPPLKKVMDFLPPVTPIFTDLFPQQKMKYWPY